VVDNDWLVENAQVPYPFESDMGGDLRDVLLDAKVILRNDAITPYIITYVNFTAPDILVRDATGSVVFTAPFLIRRYVDLNTDDDNTYRMYYFLKGNPGDAELKESCIIIVDRDKAVALGSGNHSVTNGTLVGRSCRHVGPLVYDMQYQTSSGNVQLDNDFILIPGYNVEYEYNGDNIINFLVDGGNGLGSPEVSIPAGELPIFTINNTSPNAIGKFVFQDSECYWITPEYSVAGSSVSVNPTSGKIKVNGDCAPLVDCDELVELYNRLAAVYSSLVDTRDILISTNDLYETAIDEWDADMDCRADNDVYLWGLASRSRRIAVAVSLGCATCSAITEYEFEITPTGAEWILQKGTGIYYKPTAKWWYRLDPTPDPDYETATSLSIGPITDNQLNPAISTIHQFTLLIADDEDIATNPTLTIALSGTLTFESGATKDFTREITVNWIA